MAQPDEVLRIVAMLSVAYPRTELKDATTELYVRALADLDAGLLEAAALECVTHYDGGKGDWFPSVARIRYYAGQVSVRAAQVPDSSEAWSEVLRNVMAARVNIRWSHPMVEQAINLLGGLAAFGQSSTDDEPSWRARYLQTYEALVKRTTDDVERVPAVRGVERQLAGGQHLQIEEGGHVSGGSV